MQPPEGVMLMVLLLISTRSGSFWILLEEFLPRPTSNSVSDTKYQIIIRHSPAQFIFLLILMNNYHELDLKVKPHLVLSTNELRQHLSHKSKASNYNQFSHLSKEHK